MDFTEYQARATETAVYPGQGGFIGRTYAVLGLNGEAGETGEQIKKEWRDDAADIQKLVIEAIDRFERDLGFRAPEMIPFHFNELRDEIRLAFNCPPSPERTAKIRKELGDTLWYAAQLATEIGADLGDVARENIEKLAERRKNNLIHGEGSDR